MVNWLKCGGNTRFGACSVEWRHGTRSGEESEGMYPGRHAGNRGPKAPEELPRIKRGVPL